MPVALIAVISLERCNRPKVTSTASSMLRSGVVKEIGHYVQQVFAHSKGRDLVPQDVAQQLEQGKHQQQHQESSDDHREIERKVAQHIVVKDGWEMEVDQPPAPEQAAGDALADGRAGELTVRYQVLRAGH